MFILEGDEIESRLPFKIFSTLKNIVNWQNQTNSNFLNLQINKDFLKNLMLINVLTQATENN